MSCFGERVRPFHDPLRAAKGMGIGSRGGGIIERELKQSIAKCSGLGPGLVVCHGCGYVVSGLRAVMVTVVVWSAPLTVTVISPAPVGRTIAKALPS